MAWNAGCSPAVSTEHASESHRHDYSAAAHPPSAMISSAVPRAAGFAMLGQEVFADDYRGVTVVFRGEFRTGQPGPRRAVPAGQ